MAKKPEKLSDQLRDAIEICGKTRYRIWQETAISQEVLSRFVNRRGGLSMRVVDKIGEYLGLKISFQRKPSRPRNR